LKKKMALDSESNNSMMEAVVAMEGLSFPDAIGLSFLIG
jgi:hypothetical protein